MKKIFISGLICFLLLSLIGCSSSTKTPEEVAKNYVKGLAEQNLDEMDKYSIVEYDKILKAMIEEIMLNNSIPEEDIYKIALGNEEVDKIPTNYEEYKKVYVEVFKKKLEKEYGENYSVNTTIISSTDIAEDDKSELLKEASDYYDKYNIVISDIINFSEIEEIKEMQCKAYIKGTKETSEDFSIYVVKIKTEWKVLNIGTK